MSPKVPSVQPLKESWGVRRGSIAVTKVPLRAVLAEKNQLVSVSLRVSLFDHSNVIQRTLYGFGIEANNRVLTPRVGELDGSDHK